MCRYFIVFIYTVLLECERYLDGHNRRKFSNLIVFFTEHILCKKSFTEYIAFPN